MWIMVSLQRCCQLSINRFLSVMLTPEHLRDVKTSGEAVKTADKSLNDSALQEQKEVLLRLIKMVG